ncbi:efflux RND transporter periplasmic adaptor subunit [Pseudoroseicyclus aestuarii]|uniref:RND family efflux transporter MFP subunit n=1 Tax=Pseudoroseicyclus aestuarii TaxID=1795041 RepID=A0A318SND3_9RHOB|nr:efflux RND transporter periplasmic adaptor subunit [Pseudoroseicyclus aestuarii]PYE82344.1 RND family efflux transporter MFP subunit [Pseudoroseicyclus aestuarii]
MRRTAPFIALLLAALPLAAAAQEAAEDPHGSVEGDTLTAAAPRPVVTEIITQDAARQRRYPGVVEGQNESMLAFRTTGRLATLEVEEGERIEEGQELASLDQVTLEQDVSAAEASLRAAQAQADLAQQQFGRTQQLSERGVSTQQALEQAEAGRDSSAAQLRSAQADLDRARDAARFGTLTAPRAAIVLSVEAEVGTLVSPGMPILDIADSDGREAAIDVPTEIADLLEPGMTFTVSHHAKDVAPVEAHLRLIEPVAQSGIETRRLRLRLIDPPADYRVGSLVTASYASGGGALIVLPASAIAGTEDAPFVWRVTETGGARHVEAVPVTIGRRLAQAVTISAGLEPGDEIVLRGVHSLEDGQEVGERVQQ